jgi:hypothetical protein
VLVIIKAGLTNAVHEQAMLSFQLHLPNTAVHPGHFIAPSASERSPIQEKGTINVAAHELSRASED